MKKQEQEKEKDIIWPVRIKKDLRDRFKKHCNKMGYSMSKRLRVLMEVEINQN